MLPNERQKRLVSTGILLGALTMGHQSLAQWMISGNETKIDLDSGAPLVVNAPQKDSVTLMDFSVFPPLVQHFSTYPIQSSDLHRTLPSLPTVGGS